MKKLFLMMISGFCIAGNDVRPRMEAATAVMMFWMNTLNNPQQPLSKVEKQHHLHQKSKSEKSNSHHCIKKRNRQQNAYIHQPRSNTYAAKNRR
jgi:hypothetical protein